MASSGGDRSWDTVTAILATLSWFSRCEKPAMKFLQAQGHSGRQGKLCSCFRVFMQECAVHDLAASLSCSRDTRSKDSALAVHSDRLDQCSCISDELSADKLA